MDPNEGHQPEPVRLEGDDPYGQHDPLDPSSAKTPAWQHGRVQFLCVSCGYRLSGLAVEALCPECGTPVAFSLNPQGNRGSSGAAVAALVLGIISIVGCAFYGLPSVVCGPLAIYFASRAFRDIREARAPASAAGMARGGQVCGIIGTALGVLGLGLLVFAFVLPFMMSP